MCARIYRISLLFLTPFLILIMPPKYKLIYFPVTARAEMTRLMFAAAGVDYEDYRIKWEDWKKLKPGRS